MGSVINHPQNTYYVELRQDYIVLCSSCTYRKEKSKSSAHCKALILAIMERWTNDKISKNKDQLIAMTYPQWIEAMYGMFARNVIIDSLEELIQENFLYRKAYKPERGGKEQYKYLLNTEEVNKRLKATFTNQLREEEQRSQVNDQSGKVNDATFKNQPCSSSPTLKSKRFLEVTENQTKDTEKERLTPSQQIIYDWYCELGDAPKDLAKAQGYCAKIEAAGITTREQFQRLHTITAKLVKGMDDETVYLGNMTKKALTIWKREQQQVQDEWWNQSKQSDPQPEPVQQPTVRTQVPSDIQSWFIALCREWHDDATKYQQELQRIYEQFTNDDEFYNVLWEASQDVEHDEAIRPEERVSTTLRRASEVLEMAVMAV